MNDLSRAVDRSTLTHARKIAEGYSVVLQPHERLGYMASALEFPTVWADGRTVTSCLKKMRCALTGAVATMLLRGERPPTPATDDRRDAQINVRLTAKERLLLEQAARRQGFRGISDFVRTAALSQIRQSA